MKKQVLVLALATLLVGHLYAQPGQGRGNQQGRPGPAGDLKPRQEQMADRLELTEDQQAKMEELRVAHYKEVQPIQDKLAEMNAALNTLIKAEKVDQKKVDATTTEIGGLETKLLKAKTNHTIAVRGMLTDKQKMIFDKGMGRRGPGSDRQERGRGDGGFGRHGGK